jgi:DNA-binding NarL/FixJ family response regulator
MLAEPSCRFMEGLKRRRTSDAVFFPCQKIASIAPPKRRLLINKHSPPTKRDRHIILVLSEGVTNKEIGRRPRLAEGTVKVRLHHIYRKLGIANRTELALLAHTKTFDAA